MFRNPICQMTPSLIEWQNSFNDFKALCKERLYALEAKVAGLNGDIKKLLQVSHTSVKNSAEALEILFKKIGQLREDQVFFLDIMEKEKMAKGKGKKATKDDDKVPVVEGQLNGRKLLMLRKGNYWIWLKNIKANKLRWPKL